MPTIQIEALDTLFFRDSKTFIKGEDTWADTMFPPYPSVIYGALRSAYFAENIKELGKAAENDDPTKDLAIKSICLKQGNDFYFPLPLDCVQEKGWSRTVKKNKVFVINPNAMEKEILSSCPVREIVQNADDTQIENVSDGILRESILEKYLKGTNEKEFCIKKRSDYLTTEPKIGIARSQCTHTSDEGMLYRVGMNRLESKLKDDKANKLSIIVDFEGLDIPEKGMMKMGGEGKAVKYQEENSISIDKPEITSGKFKLYLSTPAIFEKGWLPKDCRLENGEFIWDLTLTENGNEYHFKLKLLTAAIGKPVSIGGWDIKNKRPKTMRKAVPAGSVYYFELLEGDISNLHGQSISDEFMDTDYRKQGFGIAYVGAVQ